MTFLGMDPPEFSCPPEFHIEKSEAESIESSAAQDTEDQLLKILPRIGE